MKPADDPRPLPELSQLDPAEWTDLPRKRYARGTGPMAVLPARDEPEQQVALSAPKTPTAT